MVRGEVEALCRKFPLYPTPPRHDQIQESAP